MADFTAEIEMSTTPPLIFLTDSNCTLSLPDKIKAVLNDYNPTFQVWKSEDYVEHCGQPPHYDCSEQQAPFAVAGDFNGDSLQDIVLMGHDETKDLILAVLSNNDSYRVVEFRSSMSNELSDPQQLGLWVYLKYFGPNKINSPYEEEELNLTTDAVHLIYCEKASSLYYYNDGEFKSYAISD